MEHTPLKDRPWMPLAMAALGHIIWGCRGGIRDGAL